MSVAIRDTVAQIDRAVTSFLDEWTAREKRRHALGDYLEQLHEITAANRKDKRPVAARLDEYQAWFDEFGESAVGEGITRPELDVIVGAVEYLSRIRTEHQPTPEDELRIADLMDRSVGLIRRGARQIGMEYTPGGLVDARSQMAAESRAVRKSLLERLQGFDDIKAEYRKAIEFQQERLDYFYQNDAHLLTVLDYQLKNLEARPNPEDEFFAACLLYFLKMHHYKITPYLKRFQAVSREGEETAAKDTAWP